MTIETTISGYIRLSVTKHGQLRTRLYIGYTLQEAIRLFNAYIKSL